MSFLENLPLNAFLTIKSMLTDEEKENLMQVSPKIQSYGWMKSITLNRNDKSSYKEFIRLCGIHRNVLQKVTIYNIREPLLWLPFWFTEMEFINCGPVAHIIENAVEEGSPVLRKVKITERHGGVVKTFFISVPPLTSIFSF